ncbi:MAG: SHOCT-like domain-containing protein [Terriglobales bacterium]
MNAERKKILEMLVEGKITADDADMLLDKLSGSASSEAKAKTDAAAATKPEAGPGGKTTDGGAKPRFMRIVIDKPGQDQVNVRIPLAFTRAGSNLLAVLPTQVREKLSERGIDIGALCAMNAKDLNDAVENLNIDVEKSDGKKVKIFCE